MTEKLHLPVVAGSPAQDKPKVGVYVCHCGGNISDVVDVKAVAEAAGLDADVVVAKDFVFMCSDPGQNLIIDDIRDKCVNRVVVAACSPALHESTFRRAMQKAGLNPYLYQHVNVREQASWVHKADHEAATAKSASLVRAGVCAAALKDSLEAILVPAERRVAVIGGGLAGMRAALALAGIGLPATLIERASQLGGKLRQIGRLHQTREDGAKIVGELEARVKAEPLITVLTGVAVEKVDGYVGNFIVRLCDREPVTAGALVLATGFELYQPSTGELGWGDERVVTLAALLEALPTLPRTKDGALVWQGKVVRNLAIIHCVGSRQIEGVHEPGADGKINDYCSRVCCAAAMNAVNQVQEQFPKTQVYDLYRDIRTYGRGQEAMYERASKGGAIFFRYPGEEPPVVEAAPAQAESPLQVRFKDALTWNEEIAVAADLVVLATGMLPNPIAELVESMKLPVGADRFLLEAHPKLRPVEVANNGIFLAGTCQAPMDASEAAAGAGAAGAKAGILLSETELSLDPFIATVRLDRCSGCGDCLAECSYEGAIAMVAREPKGAGQSDKVAHINPALCKGCGACVAVCTPRALDVAGWSLDQYEAMVDAIVAT
jgi:heterodisulfide reductase subunit A